jgi:hypothetical protein
MTFEMRTLILDLKKTNYNLTLNFCQFKDMSNIQNDTFSLEWKEFIPMELITNVLT